MPAGIIGHNMLTVLIRLTGSTSRRSGRESKVANYCKEPPTGIKVKILEGLWRITMPLAPQ